MQKPNHFQIRCLTAFVLFFAAWLAGCDRPTSFESGQKVWIAPGQRGFGPNGVADTYAEGYVVETKGKMVRVQIDRLTSFGNREIEQALRPGTTEFVPGDQVSLWEQGKAIHEDRRAVYAVVWKLFGVAEGDGAFDQAALSDTLDQARALGMADAAGALTIHKAVADALGHTVKMPNVNVVIQPIERIGSILRKREGAPVVAQQVVGLKKGAASSSLGWGFRNNLLRRLATNNLTGVTGGLYLAHFMEIIDPLESARAVEKLDDPQAVSEKREQLCTLDAALQSALSGGGEQRLPDQSSGESMEDYLARRCVKIRDRLGARLRETLIARYAQSAATLEEAESRFELARAEARPYEEHLGVSILGEAERNAFLQPVKARRARIERQERMDWARIEHMPERGVDRADIVQALEEHLARYPNAGPDPRKMLAGLQAEATRDTKLLETVRDTIQRFVELVKAEQYGEAMTLARATDPTYAPPAYMAIRNRKIGWLQGLSVPALKRVIRYEEMSTYGATHLIEVSAPGSKTGKIQLRKVDGKWRIYTAWWR